MGGLPFVFLSFALALVSRAAHNEYLTNYTQYGQDYSCYHRFAWAENAGSNYNSIIGAYTGVLGSKYVSSSRRALTESVVGMRALRGRQLQSGPPPNGGGGGGPPTNGGGGGSGPPPSGGGSGGGGSGGGGGSPSGGSGGGGGSTVGATLTNIHTGWQILFYGVPEYGHKFTAAEITKLNDWPNPSTAFRSNSATTATEGEYIEFGQDINFATTSCSKGYWPAGPVCPTGYTGDLIFNLQPAPENRTGGCYVTGNIGYAVSGAQLWSWSDANTYLNGGVWHQLATVFEKYDMDVCVGHAAMDVYHHHSYSPCLAALVNDTGTGHSPIYGFALDSFPIFGPYQADGVLAKSCYKARNYTAGSSTGGCSDSQRSCILVDDWNVSAGTTSASQHGPNTTTTLTANVADTVHTVSGTYYEDYYYDPDCFAQGGEYLNGYNGHDHDGLGFHYHMTIDSTGTPVFPYIIGSKFYGCNAGGGCRTSLSDSPNGDGTASVCGTSSAVPIASQQCLSHVFYNANYNTSSSSASSSTSSSSSHSSGSSGLSSNDLVIIAVVVGVVGLALLITLLYQCLCTRVPSPPSTPTAVVAKLVA